MEVERRFDVHHLFSWLVQLYGKKRFFLYRPDQSAFLYPNPHVPDEFLIEDPVHPDYDRFPLLLKAEPIEAVLEPGETLYFPRHWWPVSWMEDPNITVGFDQLTTANWRHFMGDQFARPRGPPLKAGTVLTDLLATGLGRTAHERLRGLHREHFDLDPAGQLRDAIRFRR